MRYIKQFIDLNKTIKSRPTKYFLFIVAVFFALFLQAYMHNYNIVYIVLFFTFAVAGSSCLIGRLNLYNVKVQLMNTEGFFANKRGFLTLKLLTKNSANSYGLSLEDTAPVNIDAKDYKLVKVEKKFAHRGYHKLPPLQIMSFFPFGHIKFSKKVQIYNKVLVYPALKGVDLEKAFAKELARFGDLDSFDGLKHYSSGDQLSIIHWPSFAKGELQSKRFSYENEDNRLHFYYDKAAKEHEDRLSQLCLWVLQASQMGVDYVVHLPKIDLDSKLEGKDEILKQLALY